MHHYLWNWQSAHLERYNQCWKVCTCFRMTHVPIQMTSFSVYQCGFIVKDSKLACSADLLLVENICYIMKWENGTTLFSQKSFWKIFSMFICKFSIFPGFFFKFHKEMYHVSPFHPPSTFSLPLQPFLEDTEILVGSFYGTACNYTAITFVRRIKETETLLWTRSLYKQNCSLYKTHVASDCMLLITTWNSLTSTLHHSYFAFYLASLSTVFIYPYLCLLGLQRIFYYAKTRISPFN